VAAAAQAVSSRRIPWLAVVALVLLDVGVLPIAVLRRLITLWSMVAVAAAIGVVQLPAGAQLKGDF
jgi:hypothetical protein